MRSPLRNSILIIAILFACPVSRGSDATNPPNPTYAAQFDTANQLYETKQFDKAKAAYDQLIKTGPLSANLYYNRANAEWKLGNGGAAAADYERALALEPSHPQARANLDFVRDQTGAKTATQQWWERALGVLDANGAAILLSACGWAALFCLAIVSLRPESRAGAVATLALGLLLGGYAAGCLWESNAQSTKAIVIAKSAPAHEAPTDVAPIADILPAGSEVLAPEVRGPWTYCTLPNGTRAWVPTDALEKVKG